MIIELCGLPGSGKSTLEERLRQSLINQGFRIFSTSEIERTIITFFGPFRIVGTGLKFKIGKLWLYSKIILKTFRALSLFNSTAILLSPVKFKTCYWLIKDRELYRFILTLPTQLTGGNWCYLTSEGMVQHALGVIVWGGESLKIFATNTLHDFTSDKINVYYLRLSVEQALQRTASREIPKSWPNSSRTQEAFERVITKYDQELRNFLPVLQSYSFSLRELNASESPDTILAALSDSLLTV